MTRFFTNITQQYRHGIFTNCTNNIKTLMIVSREGKKKQAVFGKLVCYLQVELRGTIDTMINIDTLLCINIMILGINGI